ncbi:hypothetical protein PLANTIT3_90189 [Plantibacter sp. T3]|nr:hypothetical protein PLANTIT3_90189 [Plantibacter sp. T3]
MSKHILTPGMRHARVWKKGSYRNGPWSKTVAHLAAPKSTSLRLFAGLECSFLKRCSKSELNRYTA